MSINIRPATKEDALFLGWVVVHAAQSHLEWGFFEAELYVLHLATIAPEARWCTPAHSVVSPKLAHLRQPFLPCVTRPISRPDMTEEERIALMKEIIESDEPSFIRWDGFLIAEVDGVPAAGMPRPRLLFIYLFTSIYLFI